MYPNIYQRPTNQRNEYPTGRNNYSGYPSTPQMPTPGQPQAQAQAQAANRNYYTPHDQLTVGFEKFVRRYEINKTFASKLRGLMGYEIVLICDDSGSMNTELGDVTGPYDQLPTRWDELKHTVSIVVDLASVLDPDGVDIYFLNREPMLNVRSSQELAPMFAVPPEGATPLVRVVRQVLRDKQQQIQDRKLLLLIATDGVPTDDDGHPRIEEFRHILKHERNPTDRIPVTIIACTEDDDECMSYLNNWDRTIPNLDVVDDYKSEKKEILACQGRNFPFSFGDYIVKILMGGVDSWFDQLDEVKVSMDGYGPSQSQAAANHGNHGQSQPQTGASYGNYGQHQPQTGTNHGNYGQSQPQTGASYGNYGEPQLQTGTNHGNRGQSQPQTGTNYSNYEPPPPYSSLY